LCAGERCAERIVLLIAVPEELFQHLPVVPEGV